MSKKSGFLQVIIFLAFIGAFFVLNLVLPDRAFSQQENKYLQQAPKFTFQSLFSGKFTADFEKYTSDQFAFRDFWIPMKAGTELAEGKKENNKVYYCGRDTLIKRFAQPDYSQTDRKLMAISAFSEKADVPVYFGLIPGAADIWNGKLPANAPGASQKEYIEYCYNNIGEKIKCADIYSMLSSNSDKDIYYRTDHHWTSLGAYYGYAALGDTLGYTAPDVSSYSQRRMVTDDFLGTNSSSSGFVWVKPDSIETFVDGDGVKVDNYKNGQTSEPVTSGLYVDSHLQEKDKYSVFLGGVTPLIHISTGNSGPSLLIVRDSYTDSLVPFLTADYSDIYLVDLRYFTDSVADYVKEHDIDSVLVLYSIDEFSSEKSVELLGQ